MHYTLMDTLYITNVETSGNQMQLAILNKKAHLFRQHALNKYGRYGPPFIFPFAIA